MFVFVMILAVFFQCRLSVCACVCVYKMCYFCPLVFNTPTFIMFKATR